MVNCHFDENFCVLVFSYSGESQTVIRSGIFLLMDTLDTPGRYPHFNTKWVQIYSVSLSFNDSQAKLFLYVCEPFAVDSPGHFKVESRKLRLF